ncbi:MAG: hypothetical protein ACREUE_05245, partial [Panacagrimonas sp.]
MTIKKLRLPVPVSSSEASEGKQAVEGAAGEDSFGARETLRLLTGMIDCADIAIFAIDREQRLTAFNGAFVRMVRRQ